MRIYSFFFLLFFSSSIFSQNEKNAPAAALAAISQDELKRELYDQADAKYKGRGAGTRLGIPSLMYTSLLHPDYHTPGDNAANIDYTKLKKMADWMFLTGWKVANASQRPNREANFKLER